jgi:hypothetical protein
MAKSAIQYTSMNNIHYSSKDYPDGILLKDAAFSFNLKNISLTGAHAEYLKVILLQKDSG